MSDQSSGPDDTDFPPKVVSLTGAPLVQVDPDAVNEYAVKVLERFLDDAKSGRICGVAISAVDSRRRVQWSIAGQFSRSHAMIGGLETAKWFIIHDNEINNEEA